MIMVLVLKGLLKTESKSVVFGCWFGDGNLFKSSVIKFAMRIKVRNKGVELILNWRGEVNECLRLVLYYFKILFLYRFAVVRALKFLLDFCDVVDY